VAEPIEGAFHDTAVAIVPAELRVYARVGAAHAVAADDTTGVNTDIIGTSTVIIIIESRERTSTTSSENGMSLAKKEGIIPNN
jgi:hypothetical protein